MGNNDAYIRWFEDLDSEDVSQVGGKNSSMGEMIANLKEEGVRVPDGFATTARAYREFLSANELSDQIESLLDEMKNESKPLEEVGRPGDRGPRFGPGDHPLLR